MTDRHGRKKDVPTEHGEERIEKAAVKSSALHFSHNILQQMLSSSGNLLARTPRMMRAASSQPVSGLAAILQKNPEDVVITFAKRTAVGRAKKGQLKDTPVDEMMHALFKVNISHIAFGDSHILRLCLGNPREDQTQPGEN